MKRVAFLITLTPTDALYDAVKPEGSSQEEILKLLTGHAFLSFASNTHIFDMLRIEYPDEKIDALSAKYNASRADVALSLDASVCHQLIVHSLAQIMAQDARLAAEEVLAGDGVANQQKQNDNTTH
jgi:hypothetical protein